MIVKLVQADRKKAQRQRGLIRPPAAPQDKPQPAQIDRQMRRHGIGGHAVQPYLPRPGVQQQGDDGRLAIFGPYAPRAPPKRTAEHTSELTSLMRISYAVSCLTKKITATHIHTSSLTVVNKY